VKGSGGERRKGGSGGKEKGWHRGVLRLRCYCVHLLAYRPQEQHLFFLPHTEDHSASSVGIYLLVFVELFLPLEQWGSWTG
jgi:hypothetical protein